MSYDITEQSRNATVAAAKHTESRDTGLLNYVYDVCTFMYTVCSYTRWYKQSYSCVLIVGSCLLPVTLHHY
jgi:hypothetical protein